MTENSLHCVPASRERDMTRPWYLYDYVEPAGRFRVMPSDYNWEEREDYVDIDDDHEVVYEHVPLRTIPEFVIGYE